METKSICKLLAIAVLLPMAAHIFGFGLSRLDGHPNPHPRRIQPRQQQSPDVDSGHLIPIAERSGDHLRLHLKSGQVKVDFNDEVTTYENIRRIDVACGVIDFFTPEGRRIIVPVARCVIEDGLPKPVIGR